MQHEVFPVLEPILELTDFPEIHQIQSSSRSLCRDAKDHLRSRCESVLKKIPQAAQMHYRQLFESRVTDGATDSALQLLQKRRLLLKVDQATQFGQWRTQTAVARLMTGVSMDGCDLFSAVKRAFLASQVPLLAKNQHVILWMHVLGALEEQDPIQSKVLAEEAWGSLWEEVDAENDPSVLLLWLQTVHFVNATRRRNMLKLQLRWVAFRGGLSLSVGYVYLISWYISYFEKALLEKGDLQASLSSIAITWIFASSIKH